MWLERTELLIGEEALLKLKASNVLLVGLGGVGSYAGEFIARAGVGKMTIVDGDSVDVTNKNRQLQALSSTVGQDKAKLLELRFRDINPEMDLTVIDQFLEPEDMSALIQSQPYDYVMDCIDSVQPKVTLLSLASEHGKRVISSMGAGGKLDPAKVRVAPLYKTRECKFAQQVRKELKRKGVPSGIKAVYSEEIQSKESLKYTDGSRYKKSFYGTISYMPALFGLYLASEVIRDLADIK